MSYTIILLLFAFPAVIGSNVSPVMTPWLTWSSSESAPIRLDILSLYTWRVILVRFDYFLWISSFDTVCDGGFKALANHAFLTFIWSEWYFEQREESTNSDKVVTGFGIAFETFSLFCWSSIWSWSEVGVTNAASDTKSKRVLTFFDLVLFDILEGLLVGMFCHLIPPLLLTRYCYWFYR